MTSRCTISAMERSSRYETRDGSGETETRAKASSVEEKAER
ncbi:hypothetical protein [Mesorhizobium metallidurans]